MSHRIAYWFERYDCLCMRCRMDAALPTEEVCRACLEEELALEAQALAKAEKEKAA